MAISVSTRKTIIDIALFVASQAALYYTVRYMMDSVSPDKKEVKTKQLDALKKLGHKDLKLNEYEQTIANEVIHPDDIHVRFSDIGGLEPIISSLRESIIYPLIYPSLLPSSSLLSAPKGALLYGPPGCGKTMLAKALAKESSATFINIASSTLTNKWYGESNKLVAGLFALARKCQPCIVFIDEIDCFLRERGRGEHEVTGMMKAEFMVQWDGLMSGEDRILVLGATNRPHDIDPAILRRMPKRFAVGLPNVEQRRKILALMLADTPLAPSFPLDTLAQRSMGFSGSDLKELCRNAAMRPFREFASRLEASGVPLGEVKVGSDEKVRDTDTKPQDADNIEAFALRPLTIDDFFVREDVANSSLDILSGSGFRGVRSSSVEPLD